MNLLFTLILGAAYPTAGMVTGPAPTGADMGIVGRTIGGTNNAFTTGNGPTQGVGLTATALGTHTKTKTDGAPFGR